MHTMILAELHKVNKQLDPVVEMTKGDSTHLQKYSESCSDERKGRSNTDPLCNLLSEEPDFLEECDITLVIPCSTKSNIKKHSPTR